MFHKRPPFLGFRGSHRKSLTKTARWGFRTQNQKNAGCRPPKPSMGKRFVCSPFPSSPSSSPGHAHDGDPKTDRRPMCTPPSSGSNTSKSSGERPWVWAHRAKAASPPLVAQMLVMLGIGGGVCSEDISWTQDRDEATLRRLNANAREGEERTWVSVVVPGCGGGNKQVEVGAAAVGEKGRRRDRASSG